MGQINGPLTPPQLIFYLFLILMQESFQVFGCLEYLILGCKGTLVNYVDVNYAQVKSHNKVNIPISKCASAKASF